MRARLAAIPALLLVAIAIWEIVATRADAHAVPDDRAWVEAANIVRAAHRPGDLIVFAPGWIDPVGRLHLGDLIPLDMAGRMDADRYGRIWELSIRGAGAPEVAGLVPVEEHAGEVTVRRYERAPAVVLAELTTARNDANARPDLVEVAFEPHRCVVVTVGGDKPARVRFPGLALGTQLVGYFGIADVFTRRDNREPVNLTVEAGANKTTAIAPIDEWVRFSLPTTPGTGDVTFTLQWTPARAGAPAKSICLAAEARK